MLGLAVLTLRGRWPALAGAFAALALGAALAISAGAVLAAASGAVDRAPQRLGAAPVVVAPPPSLRVATGRGEDRETSSDPNPHPAALDPSLPERLAALPGVRRAVADRAVALRVPGGAGRGPHRPALEHARGHAVPPAARPRARRPPRRSVAPDGPLGRFLVLVTPAGPARYRVVGIASPRAGGGPSWEQPLFLADAEAARLAPRVSAVAVWPRAAAPAVRDVAGRAGAVVLTGARRAEAEQDPARTAVVGAALLLTLMALTVGFVAVFSVASAFALAVALRRRELGLLRALGATPGQVRRLALGEAALLAVVATAAGALASLGVAPLLGRWIAGRGLAPQDLHVASSAGAVAAAGAGMVCVGLAGAWGAAARASRVRPAEALRDAEVDRRVMTPWRWLAGLAALGTAALATTAPGGGEGRLLVTLVQSASLVVALSALGPLVVPRLAALAVLPAAALARAEPLLVRRHARAAVRRTAATAAPVLLAVALAGALATMVLTLEASDRAALRARLDPRAAVLTAEGPLSAADVAAVRGLAGVTAGAVLEADLRLLGPEGLAPQATAGLDRDAIGLVLRSHVLRGSLAGLRGDGVALGELTARALGRDVGDRLEVWLPDGTARAEPLEVVAVVADGLGTTGIYAPRTVLAGHVGSAAASAVHVRAADPRSLRALAAQRGLALREGVPRRAPADPTDSRVMNELALWVILGVALAYVAVTVAGTSAVATAARGAGARPPGARGRHPRAGPAPRRPRGARGDRGRRRARAGGRGGGDP
jgi:putative ABC transport system permease protein